MRVVDAGRLRNRFAATSHGFLGQDGRAPADFTEGARRQLLAYPTVAVIHGEVGAAVRWADGFAVVRDSGETHRSARLIPATEVVHELPRVPGLEEQ